MLFIICHACGIIISGEPTAPRSRAMKGTLRTDLDRIHTGARKAWNASLTTTQTPADAAKPRHVRRATCAAARLRGTPVLLPADIGAAFSSALRQMRLQEKNIWISPRLNKSERLDVR